MGLVDGCADPDEQAIRVAQVGYALAPRLAGQGFDQDGSSGQGLPDGRFGVGGGEGEIQCRRVVLGTVAAKASCKLGGTASAKDASVKARVTLPVSSSAYWPLS